MSVGVTVFLYILVFFALYTQVFLFVSFFENRKKIKLQEKNHVPDNQLPAITLLVPAYNEQDNIVFSVQSLLAVDYPEDLLRITIIDDGSTDATWERMQHFAHHPRVQLLRKENGGKYTALNYGIEHVTTPYFCSLDADTMLTPQALRKIVRYVHFDPAVVAVAGSVLIHQPKTLAQKAQNIEYQMFTFSKKILGVLRGVLVMPGAFSLFHTESVKQVGSYRHAHNMEDLELTFRLQTSGKHVEHCHDGIAYTKGPDTVKRLFKQRLRWSYGFINNTKDYRTAIFNKNFGNFGIFTLPMSIMAYIVVVTMFILTWNYIIRFFIDSLTMLRLSGWSAVLDQFFYFDWFYFDTQAITLLSWGLILSVILTILFGRYISGLRAFQDLTHIVWFILLYTLLAPFWIMTSLFNTLRSYQPSWR